MSIIQGGFQSQPGGYTRNLYDTCQYSQDLYQSVAPLSFYLYRGPYENQYNPRFDKNFTLVDLTNNQSELFNLSRPLSNCDKYKYSPFCVKSPMCTSTYDPSIRGNLAPETRPIVSTGIFRYSSGLPPMNSLPY